MRDFRKYVAWKNAIEISMSVYEITRSFPVDEKFGLSSQLRRAAVSIASNIAEGASRSSEIDFARFLEIALGSAFEVETQITMASLLGYLAKKEYSAFMAKLTVLQKQINSLISRIRKV
ncbi:four helix bundle protein [Porphyromonas levii]|uniref:four helix bundle protein n=1 Tax=Porphyromonas levii TaxID=28114 RepID=UPI001B8AA732|nr:four helix bundle protein [Porphyromonas levii]MBR8769056.1 hypothetical protein [Porphyromonas levii]